MKPNTEITNKPSEKESTHSHSSHLKMMAICCGVPIIGFLIIGGLGINAPSLETILLLVCPIGMVAMMYMMRNKSGSQGHSCCQSESVDQETPPESSKGGSCCSSETKAPELLQQESSQQQSTIQEPSSCCGGSGNNSHSRRDQLMAQHVNDSKNIT